MTTSTTSDPLDEAYKLLEGQSERSLDDKAAEILGVELADLEDRMLDANLERCTSCGVWQQSCMMNSDSADEGEVICITCEPESED